MNTGVYLEPSRASAMECFVKKVSSCMHLTIFAKSSVFDPVRQGSEYASTLKTKDLLKMMTPSRFLIFL